MVNIDTEYREGAINRHKSSAPTSSKTYFAGRNHSYVNPNYKPPPKPFGAPKPPSLKSAPQPSIASTSVAKLPASTDQAREVVIDGVAFQSSGKSLVRKDRALISPSDTDDLLVTFKTSQ